jgi:hypothetical protein
MMCVPNKRSPDGAGAEAGRPVSIDHVTLKPMEKTKVLRAIKKSVTVQRGNRAKEFLEALDASERDHRSGRVTKRKTLRELID